MWPYILAGLQLANSANRLQNQNNALQLQFSKDLNAAEQRSQKRAAQLNDAMGNLVASYSANYVDPDSGSALAVKNKYQSLANQATKDDFANLRYQAQAYSLQSKANQDDFIFSNLASAASLFI